MAETPGRMLSLVFSVTLDFPHCMQRGTCGNQESEALARQCEQEHALGQEFAREAQEWVALSTRLADDLRALKEERVTLTEVDTARKSPAIFNNCFSRILLCFVFCLRLRTMLAAFIREDSRSVVW